jgi:hypothetical protein
MLNYSFVCMLHTEGKPAKIDEVGEDDDEVEDITEHDEALYENEQQQHIDALVIISFISLCVSLIDLVSLQKGTKRRILQ